MSRGLCIATRDIAKDERFELVAGPNGVWRLTPPPATAGMHCYTAEQVAEFAAVTTELLGSPLPAEPPEKKEGYMNVVKYTVGESCKPGHIVGLDHHTGKLRPFKVKYCRTGPMFVAIRNIAVGEVLLFSVEGERLIPAKGDGMVKGQCIVPFDHDAVERMTASGVQYVAPSSGGIAPPATVDRMAIGFNMETGELDLPPPLPDESDNLMTSQRLAKENPEAYAEAFARATKELMTRPDDEPEAKPVTFKEFL